MECACMDSGKPQTLVMIVAGSPAETELGYSYIKERNITT
jgi:hypothetical protein